MSRSLLILIGAAMFCDSPRTFAAVQNQTVWQLGLDDGSRSPFSGENGNSNLVENGSTSRDDDYYFAGVYPSPLGTLLTDEDPDLFERALTVNDPRNRIHFPLSPAQASSESILTITVDLISGGAWTGVGQPGYSQHDIVVSFNGQTIATRDTISHDTTITVTVPASSVNAVTDNNIIQVERTGGASGGYIQFDFLRLAADSDGLADGDSDNIPRWYEETYGLNDDDASDAILNTDGDSLNSLGEYLARTNPTDPDTDNDGIEDGAETTTDPLNPDSDGDGISDGDETTSDPLLVDTDSDTFPDNIEIEHGTDPDSSASTPFPFDGAIGLQFISERKADQPLQAHDPAGLFRFPNWNTSPIQPSWYVDDSALTGSMSGLKNCRNQPTTVSATWSYRYATSGYHKGKSDERLLNGMICGSNNSTGKVPVILNLTGIPYPTYDLIAYVGDQYPEARSSVELIGDPTSKRYYISDTAPPFQVWKEVSATDVADITRANYVRYRNLTGAAQSIRIDQLDNDRVALHGIQIINTLTNADADDLSDAVEIEHGLNPGISDSTTDFDEDGMSNAAEIIAGTDPTHPDTDLDGIKDGDEAAHNADPLDPDSDDDTISDGDEINGSPFPSLANQSNSDSDIYSDDAELSAGTDPMDSTSFPPSVPTYDAANDTWRWRIDDLRIRWNHSQTMLGALTGNDTMLFDAVVEIDDGGWSQSLRAGIYYHEGRITHRFRCINEVFHYEGNANWSLYSTGSGDLSQALGFSGFGDADSSFPLRIEFTANRPDPLENKWTITFELSDTRDIANPVVIATETWSNAPAAHPDLLDGTAQWTDSHGNPGQVTYDSRPGVDAFITRQALGPADTDSDGMPDPWETLYLFDINNPADAALNADTDALTNLQEFLAGTNPRVADTDNDGADDAVEIAHGTSPTLDTSFPEWIDFAGTADDLDNNGLSDAWMIWAGGTARLPSADDDGDGMTNLEESEAGTDPDDPASRLELDVIPSANDLIVEWTDLPFKSHLIETSDLIAGWSPLIDGTSPSTSDGKRRFTLLNELDSSDGSNFFRTTVGPIDTDSDGVEDWVEENILGSSTSEANSMGQSLVLSDQSTLSGDARALLDKLRTGTDPTAGSTSGSRPSAVHASRFLMQSTFGPIPEDIDKLREVGFSAWLDEQMALPPSYLKPYIKQIQADAENGRYDRTYDYNEGSSYVTGRNFTTPWARHAIGAEDQLRQRVAFALSQILVISRRDSRLEEKPEAMTDYYDMLIEHAFGSYEELLLKVSLHPTMGWYLTSVGNQKADPSIPRYPDENYAREIMQLFSIGLWELNSDGTRKLDIEGEPIPTYETVDITELARVFTGLYFDAPYGWGGGGWQESHFLKPMVMYEDRHDFEAKSLLNNFIIPAREPSSANGMQDVRDAVANLVKHPSAAPFISHRLIQFLVTDNPSPAYVNRVSAVFTDDGSGERGNLGAVARAILLDPEARDQTVNENFGKVREPVIRTMHLGRLFELNKAHPDFVWWNSESSYYEYSFQEPLYAPSVFNFYTPEYQAPGDIRARGLVSPGFQIIDTYSAISFPNLLWDYLHRGFVSSWNGPRYQMDYSSSLLAAEDVDTLIDRIDLLVCTGNMSARTRSILRSTLSDPELTPQDRLAIAIWTTLNSPEGATQR